MDFVAVDFETANFFRGSPCAVGLVRVTDGTVTDIKYTLIRQDDFEPFCTSIHGITRKDVQDAPWFKDVWPELSAWIGDAPLVAHNAAFDTGVIRDALDDAGMPWPDITYGCTLVMSRRTYDLPTYRLPFVAEAAGIPFDPDTHHKASADADVAARILLAIADKHGASDLPELAKTLSLRLGTVSAGGWQGCKGTYARAGASVGVSAGDIVVNHDADQENPLYGLGVSFTGTLGSMPRRLAFQRVGDCGGVPLDGVTKHTNLLVFGDQDARRLAPGTTASSKFQKAVTLRAKGQDIEIIGEDDFLAMLQEAGV